MPKLCILIHILFGVAGNYKAICILLIIASIKLYIIMLVVDCPNDIFLLLESGDLFQVLHSSSSF